MYAAPPATATKTRWLTDYSDQSDDIDGSNGNSAVLADGRGGRGVPPHPRAF
jgi:hypothetical protein